MTTHEFYMKRCIELAKNGLGTTYPNPLVGSVIVHDGEIIGEGWHKKAGEPHAEVNAVNSVKDKSLLKEATIYVSLEPCCFTIAVTIQPMQFLLLLIHLFMVIAQNYQL